MAALNFTGGLRLAKNHVGSISLLYVQAPKYSSECQKKLNQAAWKRGTGGRSSFNGIVATVFGCSGFVGRYVCGRLGRVGTQLILPHRCDHYDMMRMKVVGDLGQVIFHDFDLRDQASIEQAVRYSNVVINLLGKDYDTRFYKMEDVHVTGARNIARACSNAGVDRLIHLSYLNSSENPDTSILKNGSRFKKSKWLGEQAVLEEFPSATIIKSSDIYGYEDRFLYTFTHWWRRWQSYLPLWENGVNTFKQPVFVADVAHGIINAAKDPDTRGQIYQAVGPKRYQLSELVDWFYRIMRKDREWGYKRYNLCYDPFFQMKITLNERFSLSQPLAYMHWEGVDKENTSDIILPGVPTLEDLGVTPTEMENIVPWLLHSLKAYSYYAEELGEFDSPAPPPTVPIHH